METTFFEGSPAAHLTEKTVRLSGMILLPNNFSSCIFPDEHGISPRKNSKNPSSVADIPDFSVSSHLLTSVARFLSAYLHTMILTAAGFGPFVLSPQSGLAKHLTATIHHPRDALLTSPEPFGVGFPCSVLRMKV